MIRGAKIAAVFFVAMLGLLGVCGSAGAVEPPEPVSHWTFDEGTGSVAHDWVGNNDGIIYGAQWTTGQIDGALSFDGDGDYVELPDDMLDSHSTGTVCAWVKGNGGTVLGFGDSSWWTQKAVMSTSATSVSAFVRRDGSGDQLTVNLDNNINSERWNHICWIQDGNNISIYVNGTEQSVTRTITGTATYGDWFDDIASTCENVDIGRLEDDTPGDYFTGTIDDVRIYDRALSAEEIWQLYQDGLGGHGKGKK